MTDRELLELAAKAAHMNPSQWRWNEFAFQRMRIDGVPECGFQGDIWNPLESDGDALRLAVDLGISLLPYPVYAESARHSAIAKQRRKADLLRVQNPTEVIELYGDDPYAATRRAIVRAAAEIGKDMK